MDCCDGDSYNSDIAEFLREVCALNKVLKLKVGRCVSVHAEVMDGLPLLTLGNVGSTASAQWVSVGPPVGAKWFVENVSVVGLSSTDTGVQLSLVDPSGIKHFLGLASAVQFGVYEPTFGRLCIPPGWTLQVYVTQYNLGLRLYVLGKQLMLGL